MSQNKKWRQLHICCTSASLVRSRQRQCLLLAPLSPSLYLAFHRHGRCVDVVCICSLHTAAASCTGGTFFCTSLLQLFLSLAVDGREEGYIVGVPRSLNRLCGSVGLLLSRSLGSNTRDYILLYRHQGYEQHWASCQQAWFLCASHSSCSRSTNRPRFRQRQPNQLCKPASRSVVRRGSDASFVGDTTSTDQRGR